ncbi:unnamed protein product [Vitrella brassicaformis CCMP3155]|uniref:RNA helicase n=2 Tax=Vitrella brassicaformis TaxID=1169539 RepID=A0A0G4ESI9_VITBC|nr:unnamed protein product [Vitrella brassicaformis CCMP3155]|eukprot:CEM01595.1 unnamed protein product [Vitrella brassicaformis CCMP3155]
MPDLLSNLEQLVESREAKRPRPPAREGRQKVNQQIQSQGESITGQAGSFDETSLDAFYGEYVPFSSLRLHPSLVQQLSQTGKDTATLIQALGIPSILTGDDVIVGAETGSGKTLAYLVPLLDRLLRENEREGEAEASDGSGGNTDRSRMYPRAVVMVPNRELCDQVYRWAQELARPLGVTTEMVWGGYESWPFTPAQPAPDVLICTPLFLGRFTKGGCVKDISLFQSVDTLVVDEADLLLDGGYKKDLEAVLTVFRRSGRQGAPTQHIMVAATLPNRGSGSVDAFLERRFPEALRVRNSLMHQHLPGMQQDFIPIGYDASTRDRLNMLVDKVTEMQRDRASRGGEEAVDVGKTIIFANTVNSAKAVANALFDVGIPVVPCHADLRAAERISNLDAFRRGISSILVCTDLAARGLDIPRIATVIQFDFAPNVVAHLHRVGRAARAGRAGHAINFYGKDSEDLVSMIQESLKVAEERGSDGGLLEQAFSRNRSLRKKLRKQERSGQDTAGRATVPS